MTVSIECFLIIYSKCFCLDNVNTFTNQSTLFTFVSPVIHTLRNTSYWLIILVSLSVLYITIKNLSFFSSNKLISHGSNLDTTIWDHLYMLIILLFGLHSMVMLHYRIKNLLLLNT